MSFLRDLNRSEENSSEIIQYSYDIQSGSYIKYAKEHQDFIDKYSAALSHVISGLNFNARYLLEVGVGEATTLANVVPKLRHTPSNIYGFDISWSRLRYAKEYLKAKGISHTFLFLADLFHIPIIDNSIDIVYTSHSIEPNGGREKEALIELMRITKRYLILLEPAYDFATRKARVRMSRLKYIKNLYFTAISLGLNVIEHRLFDVNSNPLNPTGLMVIEKKGKRSLLVKNPLICPVTKKPLKLMRNSYFSKNGFLVYPVVDGIPCLLKDNAVIASHYTDNFTITI